jgi:hypothetical protein
MGGGREAQERAEKGGTSDNILSCVRSNSRKVILNFSSNPGVDVPIRQLWKGSSSGSVPLRWQAITGLRWISSHVALMKT